MNKIVSALFLLALPYIALSQSIPNLQLCNNGSCQAEDLDRTLPDEEIFNVVSPVGQPIIKPIKQSQRLTTLNGKTIAIVGGSFMASITHPELKRLILEEYPKSTVYVLSEIGSAGVFPGPGIHRRSVEEFQHKLKKLNVDAVISGNGGCGLCTPKETGSSIAAEYIGIPAVTIAGPGFAEQVAVTAANNGIQVARVAVYPGAFTADTEETIIKNTRNILWPQIKDALTRSISDTEVRNADNIIPTDCRQTIYSGTIDDINRWFNDLNWNDGLPIIPPTMERINKFLKYGGVNFDTPIATLPIAYRNTLALHVAACGVMAGCRPEYMPILIALTKSLGHPEFRRTLASTHTWNPYCWLNGPVARQLGIDSGQGEISEEANVSIARFMNLALKNLSGYYVKQNRMGTFGYLMPWCLVEDEIACSHVGWSPYHVQQGYDINDNTVTIASALMWGNNMAPSTDDPKQIMQLIAWDITERCQFALGSGKQYTYRTILMTEPVATILMQQYADKNILERDLIETSRRPLHERALANYLANPGSRIDTEKFPFNRYAKRIERTEDAELTAIPAWHAIPEDCETDKIMTIPTMKSGMTTIILTGDNARNKIQIMPGGGYSTTKIELPNNWDSLMEELGYAPLINFKIK